MNVTEIHNAIRNIDLRADGIISDLRSIQSTLDSMIREARREGERAIYRSTPEELIKRVNWGMYEADIVGDNLSEQEVQNYAQQYADAEAELNHAGIILIRDIREGKQPNYKPVLDIQEKYAKLGAADTEGREALWHLTQLACTGTDRDADLVWDQNY